MRGPAGRVDRPRNAARADSRGKYLSRGRGAAALEAQQLIEHKLASLEHAALDRRSAATVAEVHGATREIVERELGELCQARFAALSAEQRREVEQWARTAFGRLEHAPIRAIKRWLEEHHQTRGEA
jgi:glutamyl-tRNA reductase